MKLIRTTSRVMAVLREDISLKNMLAEPDSPGFSVAEKRWMKEVQKLINKDIEGGTFRGLNPCLNEEGIHIVSGRMEYWFEHTYNTRGLTLLPSNHRFSLLYALYIQKLCHLGVAAVVSKIRRKFWIVNLPNLVKKIRYNCVTCRKLDKDLGKQIMAPLPMDRLKPCPAFFKTSLDLFGALEVKGEVNKRTKGKVFGVIFTCMYTRAVCDVSQNYSTDAFLLVLRRFVAIHGYPKKIFSDPGTQLLSASKELHKFELKNLVEESEKLKKFGVEKGFEWSFSTADAPSQNGTAESLIKSVRRGIMVAFRQQILSFQNCRQYYLRSRMS